MRNAFKAYDIRGIYNVDFNDADVYRIGFFLPGLLKAKAVLVGMDMRISSKSIYENLARGITDAGADVHYCGLSTTPMIYWATAKSGYAASVMITASHNPAQYNGLKISRKDALPVGFDSGLQELLRLAENEPVVPVKTPGVISEISFRKEYLEFLKPYIPDISGLSLTIDCSNGVGSLLIKDLLGTTPAYLYDTLDGTFPNHESNPLDPTNIVDLQKAVISNKCDAGLIFDGDADRVMFVDENGHFIQPDMMIAILADYFHERGFKGESLQDIRTSKSVTEHVESLGFTMHTWKVGRAYAALKLREINGLFGGELAGHYYFRDFYFSDSGYLAALILTGQIKKAKDKGITLSKLISSISKYYGTGEINLPVEAKKEAMDALVSTMTANEHPVAVLDFDGYRVEFKDWWFNIRPSNTEPWLRFLAEARTPELLHEKLMICMNILDPFKVS